MRECLSSADEQPSAGRTETAGRLMRWSVHRESDDGGFTACPVYNVRKLHRNSIFDYIDLRHLQNLMFTCWLAANRKRPNTPQRSDMQIEPNSSDSVVLNVRIIRWFYSTMSITLKSTAFHATILCTSRKQRILEKRTQCYIAEAAT